MRYAVITFGCRVNQADSQRLEAALRRSGGILAPAERADMVVVNTCSVTATADQGARQTIRRIARENPGALIVATGCYATRRPDEVAALPGVAAVVVNDSKNELVDLLAPTTVERFGGGDGPCGDSCGPERDRTALTLRVQTGCDEVCSYCIIPSTRGRGRSLPLAVVMAEIDRAIASGFEEVILTGVHLGSYGRDLVPPASLVDLLSALERDRSSALVRLSSLEPMDCTPEVVELVARSRRLAPHFHLPLQHASDRVLRMMRRPYTLDVYRRTVDRIRGLLPHASIGSDLIAGFPGETDEDFQAMERYLSASPLTHLHVFPYSDRPGTEAASLPDRVPGPTVRARARALRDIGSGLTRRFHAAQVGTTRPALTIGDGSVAITDNYLRVAIGAGRQRNERVRVRILAAGEGTLAGVVVD